MGEMHTRITPMDLAAEMQVSPERIGQLFRSFRDGKHPHFAGRFNRFAELNPIQVAILRGEAVEVVEISAENTESEAVAHSANIAMSPEQGRPNEVAPQGLEVDGKTQRTGFQKFLLVGVCVLCAGASVSNMLDISTQIKDSFVVACVITSIFTLAPFAVFYADVKPGVSWLVSGICIGYEVFCNTVGTYRGLANLGRGVPYEMWEPGGFIDSVSRVTTFEARPCALVVSGVMAAIIAGLFLICLNELKK